jgi:hypothetical protein
VTLTPSSSPSFLPNLQPPPPTDSCPPHPQPPPLLLNFCTPSAPSPCPYHQTPIRCQTVLGCRDGFRLPPALTAAQVCRDVPMSHSQRGHERSCVGDRDKGSQELAAFETSVGSLKTPTAQAPPWGGAFSAVHCGTELSWKPIPPSTGLRVSFFRVSAPSGPSEPCSLREGAWEAQLRVCHLLAECDRLSP